MTFFAYTPSYSSPQIWQNYPLNFQTVLGSPSRRWITLSIREITFRLSQCIGLCDHNPRNSVKLMFFLTRTRLVRGSGVCLFLVFFFVFFVFGDICKTELTIHRQLFSVHVKLSLVIIMYRISYKFFSSTACEDATQRLSMVILEIISSKDRCLS